MASPFVGPSYRLANRKAAIDRAVNLALVAMETPGKAPWMLEPIPGLILRWSLGAELRGGIEVGSRAFVVAGATLYEIFSDYTSTSRGTLSTSTGTVSMAYGLTQLVMVDGANGYTLTTSTNTFASITDADWRGSKQVWFLDNYFLFVDPDTQVFYISGINDAGTLDGLDFASAESQPDNIIGHAVIRSEALFLGGRVTESFFNSGNSDFPFERNKGVSIEVGCLATHSIQALDGRVFFIGRDKNGGGMVYVIEGGQAKRISDRGVDEALQASTDLASATSYCYQRKGLTYYAINAPGVATTWVYEVSSGSWAERADLDALGQFEQHRATMHVYAFGKNLVGDADGKVYEFDDDTFTNAGDPLVVERISPHSATPGMRTTFFGKFVLDCLTGDTPQGEDPQWELSYSKDSGATWSNPILKSMGRVGERIARVVWSRTTRGRDVVWRLRSSGNARRSIISVTTPDAVEGSN